MCYNDCECFYCKCIIYHIVFHSLLHLSHCVHLKQFHRPCYTASIKKASSAKSFSTRSRPAFGTGHWSETEVGKGSIAGSISPGIWGLGLSGRVTPSSGPPAGTSGKEGRVTGWPRAGSIVTMPSGWSWGAFSCSCSW